MIEKLEDISRKLDAVLTKDSLKCRFCQVTPMMPPIIFAKCCKVVLGCETCVAKWYEGEDASTKPCPNCQTPCGLTEILRVHDIDDLPMELQPAGGDEA